jgi:hypothetical protein
MHLPVTYVRLFTHVLVHGICIWAFSKHARQTCWLQRTSAKSTSPYRPITFYQSLILDVSWYYEQRVSTYMLLLNNNRSSSSNKTHIKLNSYRMWRRVFWYTAFRKIFVLQSSGQTPKYGSSRFFGNIRTHGLHISFFYPQLSDFPCSKFSAPHLNRTACESGRVGVCVPQVQQSDVAASGDSFHEGRSLALCTVPSQITLHSYVLLVARSEGVLKMGSYIFVLS